jgi:hypothetical protein
MTPRQHNSPMINLRGGSAALFDSYLAYPVNQSTTTRRTPVRHRLLCEHGVTLDADSFHTSKTTGSGFAARTWVVGQLEGYGLYSLRKNSSSAAVLKGHDFSRAVSAK